MQYVFEIQNGQLRAGYTTITIVNGSAEVDENDPAQVALAANNGGQPAKSSKKKDDK